MKRQLALLLTIALLLTMLPSCGQSDEMESTVVPEVTAEPTKTMEATEAAEETEPTEATEPWEPHASIALLEVDRSLPDIRAEGKIRPYDGFWFEENQKVGKLSDNAALAYSLSFSDTAVFAETPAGYDPEALLEWGKYPGLNVDILHKYGFTGEGAVVAYVDQPISGHGQYNKEKLHYTNNTEESTSMHGPAVLSLLQGKDIGTAPEAEVYFYGHASWLLDQTTHAECLYQIIEQNKSLPQDKKITMVGFSDNPDASEKNIQALLDAQKACEEAGIMVWYCGEYGAATFLPMSNKNDHRNLVTANWWYPGDMPDLVFVPESGRTTAAEVSGSQYIYWAQGGLSWTMPYMLGLYAIAIEIDPTLTQDAIRTLVAETAYDHNGMKTVNPVGFVAQVLQNVGRNDEARAMLAEAAARTEYLYAVMDTAAMGENDLKAVSSYLASITDATVLVVDAAYFADAEELYTVLQADAKGRGGKISGVQIFGTPNMVPSFEVQYKVRMGNGEVDEGGLFLTDLFYGNFENDPARISEGYNVMDHFAENWDVELTPQWPVARLPLSKGEFSAFFKKYAAFVKATGLQRQDLVSFSNPIFATQDHIDDMGAFLNRMNHEFGLLDTPYRLYNNQLGDYPAKTDSLGGFTEKNLAAENKAGIAEFVIDSHGGRYVIEKCYYENGQEKRALLVDVNNINKILSKNAYYLDTVTCLNGYGMQDNLTTKALNGNCVGMFSATEIIAFNGINGNASLTDMAKSNFFYFVYHYLKALHEGNSRSTAFFSAQQNYAIALLEDSANGIRLEGNYQFNLYNLLTYHNFGVLEPNHTSPAFVANGYITQAGQSVPKKAQTQTQNSHNTMLLTDGAPAGDAVKVSYSVSSQLKTGSLEIHSFTAQKLDNEHTRFTLEFTAAEGMGIAVFNPPNGDQVGYYGNNAIGQQETLCFDIPTKTLQKLKEFTMNFYYNDNDRAFVFFKAP